MRLDEAMAPTATAETTTTQTAAPVRLGDVQSAEPVRLEHPAGKDFIFTVPPETKAQWDAKGHIGFFEQWGRQDKTEMLPFNPEGAVKAVDVLFSIDRMRKAQQEGSGISPAQVAEDQQKVTDFLMRAEEERHRGYSLGGDVARGIANIPGYAIEFLATDGVAALGKAGVRKAIQPVMREVAQSGALRFAARTTGALAGATLRTAVMPHRVIESFAERQAQAQLGLTEKGVEIAKSAHEKPYTSALKAFGDVLVENFSEVTGEFMSKAAKTVMPKAITKGFEEIFKKLHPNEAISKLWTKAGYNGILAEMGEERLGDFLKAVTGISDFGADNPHSMMDRVISAIPNAEELLTEGLVFAVPGALNMGVGATIDLIRKRKKKAGHVPPKLKDLDIKQILELSVVDKDGETAPAEEAAPDNSAEIQKLKDQRHELMVREVGILNEKDEGVPLNESFALPAALSKSKPKYGYRGGLYDVSFENDFDRAAYIVAADNKSAKHDDFIAAFQKAGVSEAEAKAHGKAVRAEIKKQAAELFNDGQMDGQISLDAQPGVSEKLGPGRADRQAELNQVRKQKQSIQWQIDKLEKPPKKSKVAAQPTAAETPQADISIPAPGDSSDAAFEKNRANKARAEKNKTAKKIADNLADAERQADKALTPISSILGRVHRTLRDALVKFEALTHLAVKKDKEAVLPLLVGMGEMSKPDATDFDFALKTNNKAKINALADKYGLADALKATNKVLADIAERAKSVGIRMGQIADYFPHVVNNYEGLMQSFKASGEWTAIENAIRVKEQEIGAMDEAQRAAFIERLLNSKENRELVLPTPGAAKARTLAITSATNEFYKDSSAALLNYINTMNAAIETNRFFGVGVDAEEDSVDNRVGALVGKLLTERKLSFAQEKTVRDALKARFNPKGMSRFFGLVKDLSVIDVLGGPVTALRQFGDLALAAWKNGIYNTTRAAVGALTGQQKVSKEDLGVTQIAQEFSDQRASAEWARRVLAPVFQRIDTFGKNVAINGAFSRLQQAANKDGGALLSRLTDFFGDEAPQVISDLKNGTVSDNVKVLLFSELSEIQPVSMSEMPPGYSAGGNGRIFYMLKSYQLKMLDIYRREVFDRYATDPLQATKNLVTLTTALAMTGAGLDGIIDFILGKDFDLTDAVVNNVFKLMGFSSYTFKQALQQGVGHAAMNLLLPPTRFIDNLTLDVKDSIVNGESPLEWRSIRSIPHGGELFYMWFGGGKTREAKKHRHAAPEAP